MIVHAQLHFLRRDCDAKLIACPEGLDGINDGVATCDMRRLERNKVIGYQERSKLVLRFQVPISKFRANNSQTE